VALDIANLLGKSPMAIGSSLHLSTWDGKTSGQVSRVVPVQDQGLAVEKKNDELPRGSN